MLFIRGLFLCLRAAVVRGVVRGGPRWELLPAHFRYQRIRVRGGSWSPGIGFLRRRSRQMLLFTVTFLVMGVLTGLEAVCWRLVLLYLLYSGMVDQIRMAVGMGEEVGLEG